MHKLTKFIAVCSLTPALCLGIAGIASSAAEIESMPAPAAAMTVLGAASQPVGHYDFCRRYPQTCRANKGSRAPLKITAQNWTLINRVNLLVNKKVKAATDEEIYGKDEYWEYPDKAGWRGDCEDYALLKQLYLRKSGIPAADLLMTVVRKPNGEAHAVLTLRTDKGDYILDNLHDSIKNWQDTDYRYVKRQANYNSGRWVNIEPRQNAPLIASAEAGSLARAGGNVASTQAISPALPRGKHID